MWFAEAAAVGLGIDLELAAVRAAIARIGDVPDDARLSFNLAGHGVRKTRVTIVEEGIETPNELETLIALAVTHGQGLLPRAADGRSDPRLGGRRPVHPGVRLAGVTASWSDTQMTGLFA